MFRQRLGCQFVPPLVPVASIGGKYILPACVRVLNHLSHIAPIGNGMVPGNIAKSLAVRFGLRAIKCHDRPRTRPCPNSSHQVIRDSDRSSEPGMSHAFRFDVHFNRIPRICGSQTIQPGDDEIEKSAVAIDPVSYLKR